MGIHAGEALLGGRDYTGLDVHRTARICAAGWGGEVLLSEVARALLGDTLPDGASLRDLGMHQLRDLPSPERLYQLCVLDLESDFPATTHARDGAPRQPAGAADPLRWPAEGAD